MRIAIIILLLLPFTAQSQTKWRQIERSLTKWNVPAAYDSIPGQTGYAGKWISLQTLLDTISIVGGVAGSGAANKVAYWKSADSLSFNNNFHWDNSNVRLGIGLTYPNYTIHSNGAIGTNNDFFLINPTYSNSGFRIQNYPGEVGGYGVGVIKGTNASVWANANDGLLIRNDIKRIVSQSDFLVTDNFGSGKAWLGASDIGGATDVVIVDASAGSAEVTAMKYASTGYPPLHLRGHEINLHTNDTPNWPTFSTVNSADIAVTIKGDKKVGLSTTSPTRTLDVNGELRIRDLTTDNPTKLLGADNDGDVSAITIGSGLTVSGTTLSASSSTFYAAYGTLYRTNNISYDSLTDTPIIIDFNALDTFGIAGNVTTNELTISTTGKYRIEYSGAFSTDTPYVASVRFEVYKNGSSIGYEGECRTRNSENGSDNINHYSRSFIVSLSAGDDISLYYFEPSFPTVRTLILMQNVNLIIQRIN